MSFSICSYNGHVVVGIACDTELVPGYEGIVDGFAAAFDRLVAHTPGVAVTAGDHPADALARTPAQA